MMTDAERTDWKAGCDWIKKKTIPLSRGELAILAASVELQEAQLKIATFTHTLEILETKLSQFTIKLKELQK